MDPGPGCRQILIAGPCVPVLLCSCSVPLRMRWTAVAALRSAPCPAGLQRPWAAGTGGAGV